MSRLTPAMNPSNETDIITMILRMFQRSFRWCNPRWGAGSTNIEPHLPDDLSQELLAARPAPARAVRAPKGPPNCGSLHSRPATAARSLAAERGPGQPMRSADALAG